MKAKILNAILIVSSLFGYLAWGAGNAMFLFQAEAEILTKMLHDPISVIHPFTMLPMAGQILLLITLVQKTPGKALTFAGIACVGLLLGLMFLIGVLDLNLKILFSTLPFLITAVLTIRHHRKHPA